MKVLVVADGHYYTTPDGKVYADSVYDYKFYSRYLNVFEEVCVVVRAEKVEKIPKNKKETSGKGLKFIFLPYYRGPIQYLKKYLQIKKIVKNVCEEYDCAIFRIPAATSNIFCKNFSKKRNSVFAVEVVTDPWENFGKRATGNKFLLFIIRYMWTKLVKDMCKKANGTSYVTKYYLQKKYPYNKSKENFTTNYSSVELNDELYARPKKWDGNQKKFYITHAANYFSGYGKGHIILMKAVKIIRDKGYDIYIKFIGDGPKKNEFIEYAKKLKIEKYVEFVGRLPDGNEVRKVISKSDIFILPTFAEGLPRVLLEAMAEGIPCLSSPVCGIPEILEEKFLYSFEDVTGFANGIENFINNPKLMTEQSKNNLIVAKEFSSSILNKRRKEFYEKLKEKAKMKIEKG